MNYLLHNLSGSTPENAADDTMLASQQRVIRARKLTVAHRNIVGSSLTILLSFYRIHDNSQATIQNTNKMYKIRIRCSDCIDNRRVASIESLILEIARSRSRTKKHTHGDRSRWSCSMTRRSFIIFEKRRETRVAWYDLFRPTTIPREGRVPALTQFDSHRIHGI